MIHGLQAAAKQAALAIINHPQLGTDCYWEDTGEAFRAVLQSTKAVERSGNAPTDVVTEQDLLKLVPDAEIPPRGRVVVAGGLRWKVFEKGIRKGFFLVCRLSLQGEVA